MRLAKAADWCFPIATRFGAGRRKELGAVLAARGLGRPLLVADRMLPPAITEEMLTDLHAGGMKPQFFNGISPNPLDTDIVAGAEVFKKHGCDSLIALGGGSGLDGGKGISMYLSGLDFADLDYYSPSGKDAPAPMPFTITVPTTAGTGAELDSGSMYTVTQNGAPIEKRCLAHASLELEALLDPELSVGLPPHLTAWTGLDALTHAFEALCVDMYHPSVDAICLRSICMIDEYLVRAVRDGTDVEARAQMLVASAMGGIGFQKGLGAVHGLSEPVGARHNTHHGLTNAILLPHFLRLENREAARPCCAEVVRALRLPEVGADPVDAVLAWFDRLWAELQIPSTLIAAGVPKDADLGLLADLAVANPNGHTNVGAPLTKQQYLNVLEAAMAEETVVQVSGGAKVAAAL